jgi:tight adherence protein C
MSALRFVVPLVLGAVAWVVVARGLAVLGPAAPRVSALANKPGSSAGPPPRAQGRSPPSRRRAFVAACAVVAPVSLVGLWAVALGLGCTLVLPRLRRRRDRRRREEAIAAELPDVVDLLTVAVGAGLTVRHALAAVACRGRGPLARELALVTADADAGRPLADALDDLPGRAGEPTRPLAASLAGCVRYGTPIGPTLAALAAEARDTERRRMEQRARRVPVLLLFPLVLCNLPAFALLTVAPLLADALRALRL